MKKTLGICLLNILSLFAIAGTTPKLPENFTELFPKASQITWSNENGKDILYFKDEDIKVRMYFNENGDMIQTIRYYFSEKLPPFILFTIQKKYEGKKITGVTEVTNPSIGCEYTVNLEDQHHIYTLKCSSGGNIINVQKFKNKSSDKCTINCKS